MNTLSWHIFILERFPVLRHLSLILCLFGANAFVALQTAPLSKGLFPLSFVVVLIAFFRLRLLDEIKDYDTDKEINPHRPLARGVIPLNQAKKVAFSLLAIELALSSMIGLPALTAAICYGLYSLLMYKEFFIGSWLRPKLATYAITHTVVSALLALFIFSSITNVFFWQAPARFHLFTIANWMLFNVFEFGRKTFGKTEERDDVPSYSKNFGPWRAMCFVFFMALVAVVIALNLKIPFSAPLLVALLLYLLTTGLNYAKANSAKSASAFRRASSAFILLYNLIITLGFVL